MPLYRGPLYFGGVGGAGLPRGTARVSRFRVAVDIDEAALVERCLAYVSDPRPDRRRHRELFELLDILGRYGLGPPRELLELLAVEGVISREDVAAMVSAWLAEAA